MKFKHLSAGAMLGVAAIASPVASAGPLSGNVGVVSEYMFRGIQLSNGAAVQGGVDYTFNFGLYTGLWASNTFGGTSESDIYAGYALKLGSFDLTAGAIYYLYAEDREATSPALHDLDYYEAFIGGAFGPVAVKVFYTPEYGFDAGTAACDSSATAPTCENDEMLYATASVNLTLTDTIAIIPQVGFSSGDGAKDAWGDEYLDYSVTASKKLKDEFSVSLAVVGTDRDVVTAGGDTREDVPKVVIGLKKGFKI